MQDCEAKGCAYVIVTVLGAKGSTPRDSGTKMVVVSAGASERSRLIGTIGGGQLENQATMRAEALLQEGLPGQWVENFPLGAKLGQCCGGSTSLLFEAFLPVLRPLYLFGAGHVGRALAPVLATLPFKIHWVDSREQEFPDRVPDGVLKHVCDEPEAMVGNAAASSYFIIMTHEHPLDYALMEAALRRQDAAYIGVIGSESKARRFGLRMQHRGFSDDERATVNCPIGHDSVPGKHPAEIAISVASELIAHYHARRGVEPPVSGPSWKQLSALLELSGTTTPDITEQES